MQTIYLHDGIKTLGPCALEVSLHPDGTARLTAFVERDPKQLAFCREVDPSGVREPWYPFGDLSATVPPGELETDEIAVDDPAGRTGTVEALVRAGLLEPPHRHLPCANGAALPVCRLRGDLKTQLNAALRVETELTAAAQSRHPAPPATASRAPIISFTGTYWFLSNFCDSPLEFEGIRYRNAEAAFQAAKTLDLEARRRLFSNATARDAKRAGRRQVRLRPDWEEAKTDVMRAVVTAKFTQNPGLKARLLATGDAELIEGNRWGDTAWGVCGGRGENRLGEILMEVREALRRESQRNGV